MRRTRLLRACTALALLGTTAACDLDRMQFRNDDRLAFVAPAERSRVTTPFTVSWRFADAPALTGLDGDKAPGTGVFAVFLDRAPMPVGKDLAWLARDDESCRRTPACPDAQFLADRGVLLTTQPQVVVERLPLVGRGVGDEQHTVTVVLLDGQGRRQQESAWYLPLRSPRRAA